MGARSILLACTLTLALAAASPPIVRADAKPNILLIVSDDTGWGDLGPYGGGEGRGMPAPGPRAASPGVEGGTPCARAHVRGMAVATSAGMRMDLRMGLVILQRQFQA
mgnify:CR=1 FL=1